MGFFRREHASLGPVLALLVSAFSLAACSLAATHVAPPGQPLAENAEALRETMPDARTIIRVPRSADDGAGLDLVQSYFLMRRARGTQEFSPFGYEPAPELIAHDPREVVFVDTSAPATAVEYIAYAIGEREFATLGSPGVVVTASRISQPHAATNGLPMVPEGLDVSSTASVTVLPIAGDDGHHVELRFDPLVGPGPQQRVNRYVVLRASNVNGPYTPFAGSVVDAPEDGARPVISRITVPDSRPYWFRVVAVGNDPRPIATLPMRDASGVVAEATLFNAQKLNVAIVLLLTISLTLIFMELAKKPGANIFIRRIPGIDAIEEAVGRATEMGRPVLYVPGIDEIQNIQTIASLLILGRVSEIVARYDTDILVPCCIPLVANVGEEVVRQGFYDAGRPDSHKPHNVQWISSEQFAFCAGTNGIMLRDKPATNIFLGRFFAESLILAETGYVNRAIQIAGTAEISQLPFFIAACDYTLIGEELFAVSAYMTRDPRLLSTLKAADWIKALVIGVLVVSAVVAFMSPGSELTKTILQFLNPGE
ncbi:MAG: hypothetical protein IPK60_24325 [Sandaracinaceae bacterium]|nr:hypothetical protein [Sandaracinaceae bacterium]